MNRPVIILIANNELSRLCRSPIVIVLAILMLIFAFTNAAGCSALLPKFSSLSHNEVFYYIGLGNFFWNFSMLFSFISICVAVVSFLNDKQSSLKVLLTKPIYRRDVLLGKFFGTLSFLLLMMLLSVSLFVSLIMIVYGGPDSLSELILRAGSFVILLFLSCSFIVGLVIFLCIFFNKAEALMVSSGFVALEYLTRMPWLPSPLGDIKLINPVNLYLSAFSIESGKDLYTITIPYFSWLNHGLPYIVLMILETLFMILVCLILFNREEI